MADFFSLDDESPMSDEESNSLHRNCLKELALEHLEMSEDSDISEDLPEGVDWSSIPVTHRKHDRNVNEDPPMITPREHVERPRSARTAAGVRFAAAEEVFEERPAQHVDSARPRTAASRAAAQDLAKEAKVFAFSAEGQMDGWQTTTAHDAAAADAAPQAFPTPNFVHKAHDARCRAPIAVPPLDIAAIGRSNVKPHDAASARPAASASARSSSFTPRDSERSRQRQRDQQTSGRDYLDSYRQDLVAVFMGLDSRRAAKPPPKKKKLKKSAPVSQRPPAQPASPRAPAAAAAAEPTLGATLRSVGRETSAYTASPVAAAADAPSPPPPEVESPRSPPDHVRNGRATPASDDDAAAAADSDVGAAADSDVVAAADDDDAAAAADSPPVLSILDETSRLRATTANIIEQAALCGIEDSADAEQRITAIVSRSQLSSSPGKRGGRATEDDDVPKAAAASSQKAHMLPYLQRPKATPRGSGGEFGEVDWQLLYTESDGRVLTDLISFNVGDGPEPGPSKAARLCRLLGVPKAFTAHVLKAAASAHGLLALDNCRQLLCAAFQKVLEREALLQHILVKQGVGAPTYQDIVCLGRISAVVAVKLKELRRSMFWIGQGSCRCFVWGKQDYEAKMARDMEGVQLRF